MSDPGSTEEAGSTQHPPVDPPPLPAAPAEPPTVKQALDSVRSAPTEVISFQHVFDTAFGRASTEADEKWTRIRGLQDHFAHKRKWSWFLMAIIGIMVIFQSALLWCVGIGYLNFKDYQWLLPTVMIQYLTQIVGLAVFAVKSFFTEMK